MGLHKCIFSVGLQLSVGLGAVPVDLDTELEALSLLQLSTKKRVQLWDPLDTNYNYEDKPNGQENVCGLFFDVHVDKVFGDKSVSNDKPDFNDVGGVFALAHSVDRSVEIQGFACPGDLAPQMTTLQGIAIKVDGDLIEMHYKPVDASKSPDFLLNTDPPLQPAVFYDSLQTICNPVLGEARVESFIKKMQDLDWDYYSYALGKPRNYFAGNLWEAMTSDVIADRDSFVGECTGKYHVWVNGVENNAIPEVDWRWTGSGMTETFPIPSTSGVRWNQVKRGGDRKFLKPGAQPIMIKKGTPGGERAKFVISAAGSTQKIENNWRGSGGYMIHAPMMEFAIWINPQLTGGPLPQDGSGVCNSGPSANYPRESVAPENILFTAAAQNTMCGVCNWKGLESMPRVNGRSEVMTEFPLPDCQPPPVPPTPTPPPPPPEFCTTMGIDVTKAEEACAAFTNDPVLYGDCMTDYCASEGNSEVTELEELEKHTPTTTTTTTSTTTLTTTKIRTTLPPTTTNPVIAACPCTDPMSLTLKTPAYSNLGSAGPDTGFPEGILYPDAGVFQGRAVNVHLQAVTPFFGKAKMNGVKGGLGRMNLNCGSSLTFTISVKDAETGETINVGPLPVSFLDMDEGKRGSGRTTISACNAERFMADPTELTAGDVGGCPSVTSSTAGTAKDNPASVAGALVDPVGKKRVASFVSQPDAENKYTYSINLANGWKQRNVLFAIDAGMACVEGNLPATCATALADEEQGRRPRADSP